MKRFTLNWKGWWLLRPSISDVPELQSKCAVYAVIGAKLKKVNGGLGSTGRELVMFGAHNGDETLREHLEKLQKMSLGVFAMKRCKEIRKHPTIYAVALPEDTDVGDLGSILSLLYAEMPFAPKHHAMPKPYSGGAFHIKNQGRRIGLPEEIFHGSGKSPERDADQTHDAEVVRPRGSRRADAAMEAAISAEVQATRRHSAEEMDVHGLATEKVPKPNESAPHISTEKLEKTDESGRHLATEKVDKPPKFVETSKVEKSDVPQGLETERVPKPPGAEDDEPADTELVPGPDSSDEAEILDEAGREAS